ncbi:MAG: hypothetical protein J5865_01000 [Lachnospiraceae bacterium]|nr:hypothetical protein [Lachnospiraceae bacterium]
MKRPTRILAMILALAMLLSGCGAGNTPDKTTQSSTTGSTASAETNAPETTEAAGSQPSEAGTEPASVTEPQTKAAAEPVPVEEDFLPVGLNDVAELPGLDDHGIEAEPEEIDRINRVMRDYQRPGNCPMVNNAPYFYYYEQLSRSQKVLYDILMMAAEDPSGNNYVAYLTAEHPKSDAFKKNVNVVFYSMLYDHPELFWLYTSQKIYWKYSKEESYSTYVVYFYVEEYPSFNEEVSAFNDAVNDFLRDISTAGTQLDTARAIHDKLISLVDYDYDLFERNTHEDLGHTAYGALVANSSGAKNCAVCDGYSHAFNYLLQMSGIPAVLMIGYAGPTAENTGCHAWSIMNCGGQWLEADSTWDDLGNKIVKGKRENSKWLDYWKEIFNDDASRDLREHYLFGLSTETFRNYSAPVSKYLTKDGKYTFTLLSDCVHIRDCELHSGTVRSTVTAMAPVAP